MDTAPAPYSIVHTADKRRESRRKRVTGAVDATTDALEDLVTEALVEFGQIDAAALQSWKRAVRVGRTLNYRAEYRATRQPELLVERY